jgi:hypothetical protein
MKKDHTTGAIHSVSFRKKQRGKIKVLGALGRMDFMEKLSL